jgi:hypothetical protein
VKPFDRGTNKFSQTTNLNKSENSKLSNRDLLTNPKHRLLVRPKPLKNQCRQDYLMVLSEANGFRNVSQMAKSLDVTFFGLVVLKDEEFYAFINGNYSGNVKNIRHSPRDVDRNAVSANARICPICLYLEVPFTSEHNWGLTIQCPVHLVLLIDTCPRCSANISYLRDRRNFCNCGLSLVHIRAVKSPDWVNFFYTYFSPWRQDPSETGISISEKEWYSACLLNLLLHFKAGEKYISPNSRLTQRDVVLIEQKFNGNLINFERCVKNFIESATHAGKFKLNALYKRLSDLHESSGIVNLLKNCKTEHDDWVSLNSIQTSFQLDNEMGVRLFEAQFLGRKKITHVDGKSIYWVSHQVVGFLENQLDNTIDDSEAACLLSSSLQHIHALNTMGALKSIDYFLRLGKSRFYRSEVLRLISLFSRLAKALTGLEFDSSLKYLSNIEPYSEQGVIDPAWKKLMSLVFSGRLSIYTTDGSAKFSKLVFLHKEMDKFKSEVGELRTIHWAT